LLEFLFTNQLLSNATAYIDRSLVVFFFYCVMVLNLVVHVWLYRSCVILKLPYNVYILYLSVPELCYHESSF
jgi:hypothetical protein